MRRRRWSARPWRNDARSTPETTIRPRSGRSDQPRTLARGGVGVEGNGRNHDAMLFVVIRSSILSGRRPWRRGDARALAAQTSVDASDQQPIVAPPLQEAGAFTFTTFLRGAPIGTEQVALTRIADGWTIAGTGRFGAPLDIVGRRRAGALHRRLAAGRAHVRRHRARSGADDSDHRRRATTATSAISTRRSDHRRRPTPSTRARVLILPDGFFGPYEALAARLRSAAPGTDIPIYSVPGVSFTGRVGESSPEQIQTTARLIAARRTRVTLALPGAPVEITIWTDETGRMIRLQRARRSRSRWCAKTSRRSRRGP